MEICHRFESLKGNQAKQAEAGKGEEDEGDSGSLLVIY